MKCLPLCSHHLQKIFHGGHLVIDNTYAIFMIALAFPWCLVEVQVRIVGEIRLFEGLGQGDGLKIARLRGDGKT